LADLPRRLAVLGLLAGLAACAQPQPQARVEPPPGPPAGVNGRYRGTVLLVNSNNRFCPHSGPRVYEIQNGEVTFSYQGQGRERVPLTAPIKPDGTFDASDGEGRMQGKVENGTLELTIASAACEHHYTMRAVQ
jgi:hypothetical protein